MRLIVTFLFLFSSIFYVVDSAIAEEVEYDPLEVNWPLFSISNKFLGDSDSRGEAELILPFPLSAEANRTGHGWFFGLGLSAIFFAHKNDTYISSGSYIPLYYLLPRKEGQQYTIMPYISTQRNLEIEYKNANGDLVNITKRTWLTPGVKISRRISTKNTLYSELEVYDHSYQDNYHAKFGIGHALKNKISLSLSLDHYAWDVSDNDSSPPTRAHGKSTEVYGKAIYHFSSKRFGWGAAFSLGKGKLRNQASAHLKSDIEADGLFVMLEITGGSLLW